MDKNNIRIVNMVASADLNVEVDIDKFARQAENVEYEPEQFPGAIIRYIEPGTTVLLFRNGRIVIVGNRSEDHIKITIRQLVQDLVKFNAVKTDSLNPEEIKYSIPNYVALVEFGKNIDIDGLLMEASKGELDLIVEYEPDQFPGLMAWIDRYDSTALIFRNGKVILSGNRNLETVGRSYRYMKQVLNRFFLDKQA